MNIDNIEKSVKKSRLLVVILFGLTIGAYLIWFFVIHRQSLSTDSSVWGAFGDFIGGLLNPLIAYSAFYWLTASVLVQKQELVETKKALVDSSVAQQDQVKAAFRNAKIEAINMRFKKINIALEAELNYRNILIDNGMDNGNYQKSLDKAGKVVIPRDHIAICNKYIEKLENDQHLLIREVEELISE